MSGRDRDKLLGGEGAKRISDQGVEELRVVGVVEDAAGVVEQLADFDRVAARHQPGQPPFDAVIES
jgi:hypothetical protein